MTFIGESTVLGFQLDWPEAEPADVRGLAWGKLTLWVAEPHWVGDAEEGIEWTWVDLLEHLARAWGYLLHEEVAPFGLVAPGPEDLRTRTLLRSVPGRTELEVEEAIHGYQHRHDLAAGLKGIFLPPVWLLREGRVMRVRAAGKDYWRPLDDVRRDLEDLGEEIARRIDPAVPRARAALDAWTAREPSPELVRRLRTGLGPKEQADWTVGGQSLATWSARVDPFDDSPIMAAARTSAALPESTRRGLLEAIARVPQGWDTPELDELTRAVGLMLGATAGHPPYKQGYELARWLRAVLENPDGPLDPEELLRRWGVQLLDLPVLDARLDAVACWGSLGPAVLINPKGLHSQTAAGRAATLCHEIGHLIFDRDRHLPAAEIIGGSVPVHLEQRARAFAAELLLPRAVAARVLAEAPSLEDAIHQLLKRFGASRPVVGWQIRNGGAWAKLPSSEREAVKRLQRTFVRDGV